MKLRVLSWKTGFHACHLDGFSLGKLLRFPLCCLLRDHPSMILLLSRIFTVVPVWGKLYFQRFCTVHSPFCSPHYLLQPLVSICIYNQRSRKKGSRKRHKWDCHITVIHIQGLRRPKTAEQGAPWKLWALPANQS